MENMPRAFDVKKGSHDWLYLLLGRQMQLTLKELGFAPFFADQIPDDTNLTPRRINQIHRDRVSSIAPDGIKILTTIAPMRTGDLAVGDWVLANEDGQVEKVLERQSLVHRRAPGTDARLQLIAANTDILFITSSCNPDFNIPRLERYLSAAYEAGSSPVIILTKADTCDDVNSFIKDAQALDEKVPVIAVNALNPDDIARIAALCGPGKTAALIGSSGVGKTTLTNGLCGRDDDTGGTRKGDQKGRHVTTNRALRRMENGGWIIDTPGMRALRLEEASDGIDTLFDDITELAETCRFSDCAHTGEPGCAVQAAVDAGDLDPARRERWDKLKTEDTRNTKTLAHVRAMNKSQGKGIRKAVKRKPKNR